VQVEKVPAVLEQPPEPLLLPSLHWSHHVPFPRRCRIPFLGELGRQHLPVPIHVLWSDPHILLIIQACTEEASHLAASRRRRNATVHW
jgi:hypothetical protein